MKNWISWMLIFFFGFGCTTTLGQSGSSRAIAVALSPGSSTPSDDDADIKQVKDAIKALEQIDKDPTTPASIKQRNLRSLQMRRNELQVLLQREIERLEAYRDKLKATPGVLAREIKGVDDDIADLQQELDSVSTGAAQRTVVNPPVARDEPTPPAAAGEPPSRLVQAQPAPAPATDAGESQPTPATRNTAPAPAPSAQSVSSNCTGFKDNPKTYSIADRYACHLVSQIGERKNKNYHEIFDARFDSFAIALEAIAKKDRPAYLVEAEEKRVDKQTGAGPSSMGTTSLTLKGSGPEILGLAVENGALTQSMSNTTVTFSGNPLGILQALANKGYIESYDQAQKYALTRFLKNLSFSFSFDTSRGQMTDSTSGTPMQNVFTADRQQLSEVTARYEIYNQRDPRSKRYLGDWERFLDSQANLNLLDASYALFTKLTVSGDGSVTVVDQDKKSFVYPLSGGISISNANLITTRKPGDQVPLCLKFISATRTTPESSFDLQPYTLGAPVPTGPQVLKCGTIDPATFKAPSKYASQFNDPALEEWYENTQEALQKASNAQLESVIKQQLEALPVDNLLPETLTIMRNVSVGLENYRKAKQEIVDKINRGGIVTFQYTDTRNVNAPNLSNFTLIAEKGAGGSFDATFNGSLTIFDKIPMGMTKRIRDFQFSGQADAILGSVAAGNLVLSFSGRFERLMENASTPDGMIAMNTKGDIAVGQIKLTIPIKGMGIKFPISLTFANRTELIKEKEVRGNFGFTFDLDSLFAKFKP